MRQMRFAKRTLLEWRHLLLVEDPATASVWVIEVLALAKLVQIASAFHDISIQLRDLVSARGSGEAVAHFA